MRRKANLCGKTFGNIKVISDTGEQKVLCECLLCGNKKLMDRKNIQRRDRVSSGGGCGCKMRMSGVKNAQLLAAKKDITGKCFDGVKVLEWTGEKKGTQKVYRCQCLYCGKIFETRGAHITRGDTKSCGCQRLKLATAQITKDCIDGTKISSLTTNIRADNTSGVKGVSQIKRNGYWIAYIGFKGKRYVLYNGPDKDEAIKRRKEAEEKLHGAFLEWYEKYEKNK